MKYILAALLAGVAAPAWAQSNGQSAPAQPAAASSPTCLPEHAAMGHCKLTAPAPAPAAAPVPVAAPTPAPAPAPAAPPTSPTCLPEHAALGHCKPSAPTPAPAPAAVQPTPTATQACLPEHAAMGHCTPASPAPVAIQAPTASSPACLPEHAAMGHCKPATPAPVAAQPQPASNPTCLPEHAAMGHCKLGAPAAVPASGQAASASDPACLPEHAAMGHCKLSATALPPAGPPPSEAFTGPEHAQDLFYQNADAARSRRDLLREHGGLTAYRVFVDQAEVAIRDGRDGYSFDAQAWYGGDINKLWIKTEGEGTLGAEFEGAEVQALWSRAIDPWFDAQLGVRQDFGSGPDRTYLVAGVQGLAPYWFEVEGTAFLSNKGDLTARFEGEYDLRLTQAVILQPRLEVDLALQDVRELGIGSGLSTAEVGARLRYQILPSSGPAEISPYIGIQYERAFGDTARFRRLEDERVGGWNFLVGLRTWF